MRLRSIVLLSALLVFACTTWAETILGRVVGVHDGDSLTVLTAGKTRLKVRLFGIDSPEAKQPFGSRSKQSLSDLAFAKDVKLQTTGKDRYGRMLAWVFVNDLNLNEEQVRRGLAWWYFQFARRELRLRDLHEEAKLAKRGVWADPDPVPPWDWRKQKRSQSDRRS